jgi:hypothetical protein
LEMKRRENDKKIIALHVEMKDMMAVLVQYVNILLSARLTYNLLTGSRTLKMPRRSLLMAVLSNLGWKHW